MLIFVLEQNDELPAEDKNEPIHLPPPMFSRMDVPFNYKYECIICIIIIILTCCSYAANPLFKVEEVIEGNKVRARQISTHLIFT